MAPNSPAAGKLSAPPPAAHHAHVLLLPLPYQGHLTAFLELGRRLAASGLRVTLLTTQHVHAKLLPSQAHSIASADLATQPSPAPLLSFASLPDSLPDDPLLHELLQATERALEDAAALEFLLSLAAEGHPVTCIISDFSLRSTLASRAGIPEFLVATHCLFMLALDLQIDAFVSADPDLLVDTGAPMESTECIGLRQHFRYADELHRDANWESSTAWHQERVRERFMQFSSYKGLLVSSCMALEGEVYKAIAAAPRPHPLLPHPNLIQMIGPLWTTRSPSEARGRSSLLKEKEVDDCMQWLDEQPARSVVYVAFGTLAKMGGSEQLQELARGLVDSGQRFLWVVRKNATRSLDGLTENSFPLEIFEQVKKAGGLGKLVSWAPQVKVLSHPAVGGFFSHCGWNSILESIHAGVSVLAWPSMLDQFPNCHLVSHVWEMGIELKRRGPLNQATSSEICHGILELLQGPRAQLMRSNARRLKELAQADLDSSSEWLALVEAIIQVSK